MLFILSYELALFTLALVALPKILYQRFAHGKYRDSLIKKLGIGFPKINKEGRTLIWIHAVSVGEAKAVASLAKALEKKYDNPLIIISSTTETGHAEAKRSIPCARFHLFLPFDFKWIIRPILKQVQPDLVIVTETDFWYNFMREARRQGAKVILVNGKLSQRSARRFRQFRFFTTKLFSNIDLLCLQSTHYVERFLSIGVLKENIVVTGNLKFDDFYPQSTKEEVNTWKEKMGIPLHAPVLVVGSTHATEEEAILNALQPVWSAFPSLKVVLVPRHPERFDEVAALLKKQEISFSRLSTCHSTTGKEKVLLIDSMGLLRTCYQFADIALVAGSYNPRIGGHNIIEPCCYGIPTLFGPHMHAQPELVDLVHTFKSGLQVTIEHLSSTLIRLFKDAPTRHTMGAAGLQLASFCKGATEKTSIAIDTALMKNK